MKALHVCTYVRVYVCVCNTYVHAWMHDVSVCVYVIHMYMHGCMMYLCVCM